MASPQATLLDHIRAQISDPRGVTPEQKQAAADALATFQQPAGPEPVDFLLSCFAQMTDPAVLKFVYELFTRQIQMCWLDFPPAFQTHLHEQFFLNPDFFRRLMLAIRTSREPKTALARAYATIAVRVYPIWPDLWGFLLQDEMDAPFRLFFIRHFFELATLPSPAELDSFRAMRFAMVDVFPVLTDIALSAIAQPGTPTPDGLLALAAIVRWHPDLSFINDEVFQLLLLPPLDGLQPEMKAASLDVISSLIIRGNHDVIESLNLLERIQASLQPPVGAALMTAFARAVRAIGYARMAPNPLAASILGFVFEHFLGANGEANLALLPYVGLSMFLDVSAVPSVFEGIVRLVLSCAKLLMKYEASQKMLERLVNIVRIAFVMNEKESSELLESALSIFFPQTDRTAEGAFALAVTVAELFEGRVCIVDSFRFVRLLDFVLNPDALAAENYWLFVQAARSIQRFFCKEVEMGRPKPQSPELGEYAGGFFAVAVALATNPAYAPVSAPFGRVVRKFAKHCALYVQVSPELLADLKKLPNPDNWFAAGFLIRSNQDALMVELPPLLTAFEANDDGRLHLLCVLAMLGATRPVDLEFHGFVMDFLAKIKEDHLNDDEVLAAVYRAVEVFGARRATFFLEMGFDVQGIQSAAALSVLAAGVVEEEMRAMAPTEAIRGGLGVWQMPLLGRIIGPIVDSMSLIKSTAVDSEDYRFAKRAVNGCFKYIAALLEMHQGAIIVDDLVAFLELFSQNMYRSPQLLLPYVDLLVGMAPHWPSDLGSEGFVAGSISFIFDPDFDPIDPDYELLLDTLFRFHAALLAGETFLGSMRGCVARIGGHDGWVAEYVKLLKAMHDDRDRMTYGKIQLHWHALKVMRDANVWA
jgi:hypothetical protein